IICEYNCDQVVFITISKGLHVFYVSTLETVDTLIIIANNKYIWFIPIIDQQLNHPVLRSARILVFVNQYVKKLFLVLSKQVFIFFKSFYHPIDHVIKIIAVPLAHHFLKSIKFIYCCPQSFHSFFFFFNTVFFQVTGIEVFIFSFVNKFIPVWRIIYILINFLINKRGRPAFSFHSAEKPVQIFDLIINITTISF